MGLLENPSFFTSKFREVLRFPANLLIQFRDRIILVQHRNKIEIFDILRISKKKEMMHSKNASKLILQLAEVSNVIGAFPGPIDELCPQPWRVSISRSSSALRGGPL